MKNFLFFPMLSVVTLGSWAQPAVIRDPALEQNVPELRRAELRSALKTTRGRELPGPEQPLKIGLENRHLTDQERADLRQQLRQQRRDMKLD